MKFKVGDIVKVIHFGDNRFDDRDVRFLSLKGKTCEVVHVKNLTIDIRPIKTISFPHTCYKWRCILCSKRPEWEV